MCDVSKVIVIPTGGGLPPAWNHSDWVTCTEATAGVWYAKLFDGTNNLSIWYQDDAHNVSSSSTDFTISYTESVIASPDLYIAGDRFYAGAAGAFDRISGDFFVSQDNSKATLDSDSIVGESFSFIGDTYIERSSGSINPTTDFTFSSWVKLAQPSSRAMIISIVTTNVI